MKTITTKELLDLLPENPRLIDVREDFEFDEAHIAQAKNVPLSRFEMELFSKTEPNYIICRSGNRSMQACAFLEQEGYEVVNIDGGMLDWQGEVVLGD